MKIYITDGTLPCFYTAVFYAYPHPSVITSDSNVQLSFDSEIINVVAEEEKSGRVRDKLISYDELADDEINLVLRCCDTLKEQTSFEYIKLLMRHKSAVRGMLSDPTVLEFTQMRNRVTGETHRMKGFLRFMETSQGMLYAPYSPDNDITELLAPHFAERMKTYKFVIHDLKRKKAALYNGEEWIMSPAGEAEVYLSEYERSFETLWKKYYRSVNIADRPHDKQMKGYMPVRYWKFLPEKKDNG